MSVKYNKLTTWKRIFDYYNKGPCPHIALYDDSGRETIQCGDDGNKGGNGGMKKKGRGRFEKEQRIRLLLLSSFGEHTNVRAPTYK